MNIVKAFKEAQYQTFYNWAAVVAVLVLSGVIPAHAGQADDSSVVIKADNNMRTVVAGDWQKAGDETDSDFTCTDNKVLVGRQRVGNKDTNGDYPYADEHGHTNYKCAQVSVGGLLAKTQDVKAEESVVEESSEFLCPANTVMVGRAHSGDEGGGKKNTTYKCGVLKDFNGHTLDVIVHPEWSVAKIESGKDSEADDRLYYICPENEVMVGRKHTDDENGKTQYKCAKVY